MRVTLLLLTGLVCGGSLVADGDKPLDENAGLKRTAVTGQSADLTKDGGNWKGILRGDGEAIVVDRRTQVLFQDGATERIEPGFLVTYEGQRNRDGLVAAARLEISTNPISKNEEKLWRSLTPRIKAGGPANGPASEIEISGVGRFELLQDAEAQSYIQRIGESVAPAYLRELPAGTRRKIDLQFYLVRSSEFGAFSLANGTVIVNAEVLRVVANEAQLAAILAHEIAHVTQQHEYREAGERGLAAVRSGYPAELEDQADRIALGYLAAAGYDPREAAAVWTAIGKLRGTQQGPTYWGNAANANFRQSYLSTELRNNYSSMNLISYSLGGNDLARIATRLGDREADPRAVDSRVAEAANAQPAAAWGRGVAQKPQADQALDDSGERQLPFNTVTISSNPPGCNVLVGGRLAGKTPLTLVTGNVGLPFMVTVQKPGYLSWTVQSMSVAGNAKLHAELVPAR